MTGHARTRTQRKPGASGAWKRTNKTSGVVTNGLSQGFWSLTQTTSDIVGDRAANNPFTSEKVVIAPIGLTGNYQDSTNKYEPNGHIPSFYLSLAPGHNVVNNVPSIVSSTETALARTNPSRPEVSLPDFIGQLKDIPFMIKNLGDLIRLGRNPRSVRFSNGAGQFLNWTFGVRPFLSDLNGMLNFALSTDRRVNELQRLYSQNGLRRRIHLGNWTGQGADSNVTIDSSFDGSLRARSSSLTTVDRWATVRWRPNAPLPIRDGEPLRHFANGLVKGWTLQEILNTGWDLVPFTWLVDWFAEVQDHINAHNNAVPASPTRVSIMTRTSTNVSYTRTDGVATQGGSCVVSRITKNRTAGSSGLGINLPFLNGGQLAILGSLAILRMRR
ncbi:MAG: putative maturation protein [Lipwuvirus nemorishabitans]|uniref:Maturation protein n=1 Tax=Leviviridae sp. TaxID=2027243 RepID=A0ABY3SSS6_9VIRU|nr:MAG: putative maturation protein [Leviviridae sp.]